MKKIGLIILAVLLCLSVSLALAELPAPFERARIIALTGEQVEDHPQCFTWNKEVAIDSIKLTYVIGFCKSDNSLALIKIEDPNVVFIMFDGKIYAALIVSYGIVVDYQEISQEDAVKAGFGFFRELVDYKLLN